MNRIIDLLRGHQSTNVFNPWLDQDAMDAQPKAADARVERLSLHFNCEPKVMLLGEAPGYQGCHFSGIPFTNEKLILDGVIPRVFALGRLTTRARPWCEPSATVVWSALRGLRIAEHAILWNAFAWHPHEAGNRYSNRAPTRAELAAGLSTLKAVIGHFDGVPIVPVGRVAATTLEQLGIDSASAVRHPAFGGANAFRAGVAELFSGMAPLDEKCSRRSPVDFTDSPMQRDQPPPTVRCTVTSTPSSSSRA